jgi:hypothetical protein
LIGSYYVSCGLQAWISGKSSVTDVFFEKRYLYTREYYGHNGLRFIWSVPTKHCRKEQ